MIDPGRELDALVAENVMGASRLEGQFIKEIDPVSKTVSVGTEWYYPPYSTDIRDAWEVVEKLLKKHWYFNLRCHDGEWSVLLDKQVDGDEIRAPTAPHAICLAALKALKIQI